MTIAPGCSRCAHSAIYHEYSPLACAHCALSPIAHAQGIGCGDYLPREGPCYGARCNAPRCACLGYVPCEGG